MTGTSYDTNAADEAVGRLIFDPAARADPYPVYAAIRDAAPVHRSAIGFCLVMTFQHCSALLKDPRLVRRHEDSWEQRAVLQNAVGRDWVDAQARWILWLDPPDHTRLRGLVSKAFTPRYVARLRGRVAQIVDELLDRIDGAGRVDLIEEFAFALPITIICDMLGVPVEDRGRFRDWTVAMAQTLEPLPPEDVQDAADEAARGFDAYFKDLIAQRRREPRDDLLHALIAAEEDGERLTEEEIVAQATLLLGAGFETTTNLIGNGVYALLRHPAQWRKLVEAPERSRAAVEELLRYDGSVQMATPRVANAPVEVGGQVIEPGEMVINVVASANRDPARHDAPDALDLDRPDPEPLSFGGGPHFCLGASLARLEAAEAFGALARRLPGLELADDHPTWRRSLNLRGLESLHVVA